jgi:hypothetical protein
MIDDIRSGRGRKRRRRLQRRRLSGSGSGLVVEPVVDIIFDHVCFSVWV